MGPAVAALAAAGLVCAAGVSRAQVVQPPLPPAAEPRPVVPRAEDLAPRQVVPPTDAALPAAPAAIPRELAKSDDDLRIEIRRFELDPSAAASAPAALAAALPGLTSDLIGPDKGFEALATARARITRFLQSELGYYLGYAYVPEQTLRDGVVRIAVLEGRLDRVVLRWPEAGLPVRREVVQAYLEVVDPQSDREAPGPERPVRWLAGFAVVAAEPGAAVHATVVVPRRAFEVWDVDAQSWVVPPGLYRVRVGRSVRDLRLAVDVHR